MKIRVLEDISAKGRRNYATIEIPDEDYSSMLDADYEQRLSETAPEKRAQIKRCTTVQEMFDLISNREYNNWRRYHRHIDSNPKARRMDGRRGFISDPEDESFNVIEYLLTEDARYDHNANLEDEEVCQWIRATLARKPEWANAFIACRINGMTIREYSKQVYDSENNITQKLKRAAKKLGERYKEDFADKQ